MSFITIGSRVSLCLLIPPPAFEGAGMALVVTAYEPAETTSLKLLNLKPCKKQPHLFTKRDCFTISIIF